MATLPLPPNFWHATLMSTTPLHDGERSIHFLKRLEALTVMCQYEEVGVSVMHRYYVQ